VEVHDFSITGSPQHDLLITSELPLSATAGQDAAETAAGQVVEG
jgi:hypothetical protein